MSIWFNGGTHAPTLVSSSLIDYNPETGRFRAWEAAADRAGNPVSFPCHSASSGALDAEPIAAHQLVAVEANILIDYHSPSGACRALHCPPLAVAEGVPGPSCRKLGFAAWPAGREAVFLGRGRVMAWERASLRYDVWSFAPRGNVLRNSSGVPFFQWEGQGRLAGVSNESALMHLRLAPQHGEVATDGRQPTAFDSQRQPTADGRRPAAEAVSVVLEILAESASGRASGRSGNGGPDRGASYRVWNSEGWASLATPPSTASAGRHGAAAAERSPLAGPVGRGYLPGAAPGAAVWASSATEPLLVELDTHEGSYRTVGVRVLDFDTLAPATTTQPPLHFFLHGEGALDQPMRCGGAPSRAACAAMGGPCGWCEESDGVGTSRCLAGGPARPCAGSDDEAGSPRARMCGKGWHFFDDVSKVTPPPMSPSPPPPSPPGLSEDDLLRLEAASVETSSPPPDEMAGPEPPDGPFRVPWAGAWKKTRRGGAATWCECREVESLPLLDAPHNPRREPVPRPPSEPCPPGCISAGGEAAAAGQGWFGRRALRRRLQQHSIEPPS